MISARHRPSPDPPADDTRLWRYQTFDKFIQLLDGRALWFARADQFEDRFEMAVPTRDLPAARAGLLNSLNELIIKEKVWSYLRRRGRYSLLFIDGHADFYQPVAEPTGEAASMDLVLVTGRGSWRTRWRLERRADAGQIRLTRARRLRPAR